MRRALLLALLLGCRSETAATTDAGVEEGDAVVCPPPLTTAQPRTAKPTPGPLDDLLHVNHLQIKATHNSYHLKNTGGATDWRYGHAPLTEQLENQGVRGFELDTHWNEACGRYEVYHLTKFDEGTTCRVFVDCLRALRTWSDAHAQHPPLFIQIEPKDDGTEARFVAMEREILSVFPRELVITPDEIKGSSPTLREQVLSRGWPRLSTRRSLNR